MHSRVAAYGATDSACATMPLGEVSLRVKHINMIKRDNHQLDGGLRAADDRFAGTLGRQRQCKRPYAVVFLLANRFRIFGRLAQVLQFNGSSPIGVNENGNDAR